MCTVFSTKKSDEVALNKINIVPLNGTDDDPNKQSIETTLLGIMFIVVGQLLSASQMVLQELFMSRNPNIHPMQVRTVE